MKVDTREYLTWLLTEPVMTRMPKVSPKIAQRVARLIADTAHLSDDCPGLKALALDIWALPFRLGWGKPARKSEAEQFLKECRLYFPPDIADKALTFLKNHSMETLNTGRSLLSGPRDQVTYRNQNGEASFSKKASRRWPRDDLKERICHAGEILAQVGCPHASTVIAEILGGGWTREAVESRMRGCASAIRTSSFWKMGYWVHIQSGNRYDPCPETFDFTPWNEPRKRSPIHRAERGMGRSGRR